MIAAKAQCFYEALQPDFEEYQLQVRRNINALAEVLIQRGIPVVSGGTDNHLILIDVYNSLHITGKEAETTLDKIHITVNKNTIPGETLSPAQASGIRIGSPAMTTRGFGEKEFRELGNIICDALACKDNDDLLEEQAQRVLALTAQFPTI